MHRGAIVYDWYENILLYGQIFSRILSITSGGLVVFLSWCEHNNCGCELKRKSATSLQIKTDKKKDYLLAVQFFISLTYSRVLSLRNSEECHLEPLLNALFK